MPVLPSVFAYESMGTKWKVTVWDALQDDERKELESEVKRRSKAFESAYSRFDRSSLVWSLTEKHGVVAVPRDLVQMLRLYEKFERLSEGKFTPLVGFSLSDMGYDKEYSFEPKKKIRPVPKFSDALHIVDEEHIELSDSVLIDVGAVGKGYFVDMIAALLRDRGYKRFLVDGSGDIFYEGDGQTLRCGLEHPADATKVIGVLTITGGAFCGSASNRRRWHNYHHIIDPQSLASPQHILATWVQAPTAAEADALATCVFLCDPEKFSSEHFEYCMLNDKHAVKRSAGFGAELF